MFANYNNKQKLKWDNKVEMRLGYHLRLVFGDALHQGLAQSGSLRRSPSIMGRQPACCDSRKLPTSFLPTRTMRLPRNDAYIDSFLQNALFAYLGEVFRQSEQVSTVSAITSA